MRVLACGDLHVEDKRIAEYVAALDAVLQTARDQRPNLTVVCGDLCGRHVPHRPTAAERNLIARFLVDLAATSDHVAVVRGNHDPVEEWRWIEHLAGSVSWSAECETIDGDGWALVVLPALDRGQVRGSDHAAGVVEAYGRATSVAPGEDGVARIVAAHAPVLGAVGIPAVATYQVPAAAVVPAWADLAVLSDVHTAQAITDCARYTGAIVPGVHGEQGPWGFFTWTNDGGRGEFRLHLTPCTLRVVLDVDEAGRVTVSAPERFGLATGIRLQDSAGWAGWSAASSVVVRVAAADTASGSVLAGAIRSAIRPLVPALDVRVMVPRVAPVARAGAAEVVEADGVEAQVAAFATQRNAPAGTLERAGELLAKAVQAGVADG